MVPKLTRRPRNHINVQENEVGKGQDPWELNGGSGRAHLHDYIAKYMPPYLLLLIKEKKLEGHCTSPLSEI